MLDIAAVSLVIRLRRGGTSLGSASQIAPFAAPMLISVYIILGLAFFFLT